MAITPWPLADRSELVQAFRPGAPGKREAPYRTLRQQRWATAGVSIVPHRAGKAAGRVTLFSSLNIEAARLARHGSGRAALEVAREAAKVEASAPFIRLSKALAGSAPSIVQAVIRGGLPEKAPREVAALVREIARATEERRRSVRAFLNSVDMVAGRISEVSESYVVVRDPAGPSTALPRWLARDVQREAVGDCVAVLTDRFEGRGALVEAVPAIDTEESPASFSPFGRSPALDRITAKDAKRLRGLPDALRIIVPVRIE